MILAKVIGNIVSTRKEESLVGFKLLLLQQLDPKNETFTGESFIAVDTLGAGISDEVLVVRGGGARVISEVHRQAAIDAAIIGIIDTVDVAK